MLLKTLNFSYQMEPMETQLMLHQLLPTLLVPFKMEIELQTAEQEWFLMSLHLLKTLLKMLLSISEVLSEVQLEMQKKRMFLEFLQINF